MVTGGVQVLPRSGEVASTRSVGCGSSRHWGFVSQSATKPTGSSLWRTARTTWTCPEVSTVIVPKILSALSPIFVTGSNAPCQAR